MRICIDIQPAVTQRAGIGRYVSELVGHLPKEDDCNFDLFYFDFKGRARPPRAESCTLKRYSKLPGMLVQQAWKRVGWPRFDSIAGDADLYHFPNFIIPPLSSGKKAVVSIHDISFILHPEFAEKRNLDYLSRRIKATVQRADAVITISEQSASDINKHLGVPREKLSPIHLGVSQSFQPAQDEDILSAKQALGLDRPFILMVGTFEPRKNIPYAVELFEKMSFFDGDLVIVGQKGWKNEAIFDVITASSRSARIKTIQAVSDQHLVSLYSGAEFLLMTSLYEGFGFPPVEAMACHTPVLTSAGGSLAEICGDAAIVIEEYDPELWLEKAQAILHDSGLRNDLVARGIEKAKNYTWQKTADEHVSAYRKVVK